MPHFDCRIIFSRTDGHIPAACANRLSHAPPPIDIGMVKKVQPQFQCRFHKRFCSIRATVTKPHTAKRNLRHT